MGMAGMGGLLASAASLAAANAAAAARQNQEAAVRMAGEVWASFADRMGFPPPGTTASALPFLDGALNGVRFRLRIVRDETGWAHTQALADAIVPTRAEVGVFTSAGGFLDWVKAHFDEDIEIGDAPFDRAFVIRARPSSAAASILTPDVRQLVMSFLGHALAGLTYKDGTVAIQWRGVERDAAVLEHAVRLVVAVAMWNPGGSMSYRDATTR
jgi:hypothetical protein